MPAWLAVCHPRHHRGRHGVPSHLVDRPSAPRRELSLAAPAVGSLQHHHPVGRRPRRALRPSPPGSASSSRGWTSRPRAATSPSSCSPSSSPAWAGSILKNSDSPCPRRRRPSRWATLIGGIAILVIEWSGARPPAPARHHLAHRGGGGTRPASRRGVPGHVTLGRDHPDRPRAGREPVPPPPSSRSSWASPPCSRPALYETQHALRHPGPVATDWGLLALGTVVSAVTAFSRGALAHPVDTDPQLLTVRLVPHRPRSRPCSPA